MIIVSRWSLLLPELVLAENEDGVSTIKPELRPEQRDQYRYLNNSSDGNVLSTFTSYLSPMFSPRFRISRSIRSGFRRISRWPYQYDRGSSALDTMWLGAVVALEPRGAAGVDVCNVAVTGTADIAPGMAHPPYGIQY